MYPATGGEQSPKLRSRFYLSMRSAFVRALVETELLGYTLSKSSRPRAAICTASEAGRPSPPFPLIFRSQYERQKLQSHSIPFKSLCRTAALNLLRPTAKTYPLQRRKLEDAVHSSLTCCASAHGLMTHRRQTKYCICNGSYDEYQVRSSDSAAKAAYGFRVESYNSKSVLQTFRSSVDDTSTGQSPETT